MILKKKRQRVWCKEKPTMLGGCPDKNTWISGKRIRNTVTEKSGKKVKLPTRVKCPDCRKRFKPRIRECHDPNCWHVYLPAHKKMI